ncbi:MAG: hypothetical protein HY673_07350 [Chloroflexi bacterium]|nr:hypothetical protein [Chloroflexota bacterium]
MDLSERIMHSRLEGKTLRQLGMEFALSHERVRQILVKKYSSTKTGFSQSEVKKKLHVSQATLARLRTKNLIRPRLQGCWLLFSEMDMVRIAALLNHHRCPKCGRVKPKRSACCRRCSRSGY